MRDIPGLDAKLIKRAAARAKAEPVHRFHGTSSPVNRERVPVAYASPAKVRDGVAKLRLYDVIDSWGGPWGISAAEFADALDELPDDVESIRLHVNSPGGEVWEGLAIMNQLRDFGKPVTAVVDGIAASAASFIAVAADELVMGQNTQLMIHDALGICIGQAPDMRDFADFLDRTSDNIASIYAAKTGDASEWRELMIAETWFSAEEAIDAGLADSIAGTTDSGEDTGAAENRFDLKAVGAKYADRTEAPAPAARAAATRDEVDEDRARHLARRHAENSRKAG